MSRDREDIVPDVADAYALLDDGEIKSSKCPHCANWICTCDDDDEDIIADARKRYRNLYHAQHPYNPDR